MARFTGLIACATAAMHDPWRACGIRMRPITFLSEIQAGGPKVPLAGYLDLFPGTFPIAELLDHVPTEDGVERQRVHDMVGGQIGAEAGIVCVQHVLGRGRLDVVVAVVAGMKQQPCVALDANIADAQEQRASRLAMTFDPEQLARLIVLTNDRIETREKSAHAIAR